MFSVLVPMDRGYAWPEGLPGSNVPLKTYHNNNNNNNNNVCTTTLQHMQETGVQLDKKHWYEHVPKSVETSQACKVTILWNQQIQTNRTIPNNKPDIIIRDNEKGTCMLIDVAI